MLSSFVFFFTSSVSIFRRSFTSFLFKLWYLFVSVDFLYFRLLQVLFFRWQFCSWCAGINYELSLHFNHSDRRSIIFLFLYGCCFLDAVIWFANWKILFVYFFFDLFLRIVQLLMILCLHALALWLFFFKRVRFNQFTSSSHFQCFAFIILRFFLWFRAWLLNRHLVALMVLFRSISFLFGISSLFNSGVWSSFSFGFTKCGIFPALD